MTFNKRIVIQYTVIGLIIAHISVLGVYGIFRETSREKNLNLPAEGEIVGRYWRPAWSSGRVLMPASFWITLENGKDIQVRESKWETLHVGGEW
jgi:hypothetical protein